MKKYDCINGLRGYKGQRYEGKEDQTFLLCLVGDHKFICKMQLLLGQIYLNRAISYPNGTVEVVL